jgi:hypothetical protein
MRIINFIVPFHLCIHTAPLSETALVWFAFIALYGVCFYWKSKKIRPGMLVVAGLQGFTTALYFLLRFTVLQFQSTNEIWGTTSTYANSLIVRLMTFLFEAVPQYLEILLWPTNLHMERSATIIQRLNQISWQSWGIVAALICVSILLVMRFRRRPIITDPITLGCLLLAIGIAPFSGILPLNDIVLTGCTYQ